MPSVSSSGQAAGSALSQQNQEVLQVRTGLQHTLATLVSAPHQMHLLLEGSIRPKLHAHTSLSPRLQNKIAQHTSKAFVQGQLC